MVQNIQNPLAQLKDIKPIVEVHTNSLIILMILISIVVLILFVFAFKYFTRVKKTKIIPKKKIILQNLKNLNYKNTKEVVYHFSVDAYLFVNEKNKDQFETIEKELEMYKYKKDVEQLPKELIIQIKEFIEKLKRDKNDK